MKVTELPLELMVKNYNTFNLILIFYYFFSRFCQLWTHSHGLKRW